MGDGDFMNRNKKIVFIFVILLILLFLFVGFLVINDIVEERRLESEINSLMKFDITTDRYNTEIKCSGEYALVEEAIKDYLDSYAVDFQSVLALKNDQQFLSLLSVSNYSDDGPEFSKSIEYIEVEKEKFNSSIDALIVKCDEERIKENIYNYTSNSYFVELYNELMLNDDMSDDFNTTKKQLEDLKENVNVIFDTSLEIFHFLKLHQGEWEIQDNQIKFKTTELVNAYNNLINQVNIED